MSTHQVYLTREQISSSYFVPCPYKFVSISQLFISIATLQTRFRQGLQERIPNYSDMDQFPF